MKTNIQIDIEKNIETYFEEAEKYLQEKEYMKAYFKFNDIITICNSSIVKGYYSDAVFGMYRSLYEYGKSLNKWNHLSCIIYKYAMSTTKNKSKQKKYTEIFFENLDDFYNNIS